MAFLNESRCKMRLMYYPANHFYPMCTPEFFAYRMVVHSFEILGIIGAFFLAMIGLWIIHHKKCHRTNIFCLSANIVFMIPIFLIARVVYVAVGHDKYCPETEMDHMEYRMFGNGLTAYFSFHLSFLMPNFAVERFFATRFVADYEKNPRLKVSLCLIAINHLWATVAAVTFVWRIICISHHVIFIAVVNVPALILFYKSSRKNVTYYESNLRYGSASKGGYSLSQRFQIEKNIRVSKTIRSCVLLSFLPWMVGFGLFSLAIYTEDLLIKNSIFEFFDLYLAGFMCCVPLLVSPDVRHFFGMYCKSLKITRLSRVSSSKKGLKSVFGVELMLMEETKTYFNQLNAAWDIAAPPMPRHTRSVSMFTVHPVTNNSSSGATRSPG